MNKISEVKNVATEASKRFLEIYTKEYTTQFIKKIKESFEETPRKYFLLDSPEDKRDLSPGVWIQVADREGKKWKECIAYIRWNYSIECYDIEPVEPTEEVPKPKKAKMLFQIFPKGLKYVEGEDVQPAKESEGAVWFKHERRVNYYFAKSEKTENWDEFLDLLKVCPKEAKAPLNPNKVGRKAFEKAYRRTRWWYMPYTSYTLDCTERECFGAMVYEIIAYTVLRDVPLGGVVKKLVDRSCRSAVEGTTGAAWKAASEAVDAVADKIEGPVREAIRPIVEVEQKLNAQIDEKGIDKAGEVVAEHVSPYVAKIVDFIKGPIVNGFKKFDEVFTGEALQAVDRIRSGEPIDKVLKQLKYEFQWSGWRKLNETSDIFRSLDGDVKEIIDLIPHVSTYWDFFRYAEDKTVKTAKRAIATLNILVKSQCMELGVEPAAVIDDCMTKVLAWFHRDVGFTARRLLETRLFLVFWKPIESTLLKLLLTLVEPLNDAIPDPVKNFIDLEDLTERFCIGVLEKIAEEAVNESVGDMLEAIEVDDCPEPLPVDFKLVTERPAATASLDIGAPMEGKTADIAVEMPPAQVYEERAPMVVSPPEGQCDGCADPVGTE